MVKGTSAEYDLSWLATAAHPFFGILEARIYFEHVSSLANCSDGLSRDGVLDSWVAKQAW